MSKIAIKIIVLVLAMVLNSPVQAEKKAFVVGIGAYANLPQLKGPADDAVLLGSTLEEFGFKVTMLLTKPLAAQPAADARLKTDRALIFYEWQTFLNSLNPGDEVVVSYSGHGVEIKGMNYLVPTDAPDADQLDDGVWASVASGQELAQRALEPG